MRWKSFLYAFEGIIDLIRFEKHFLIHILAFLFVISLGLFFQISSLEWISLLLVSALVLVAEAINTALEHLCDHVTPEKHFQIKKIKDISAGAVLMAALFSVAVGCFIFIPYLT